MHSLLYGIIALILIILSVAVYSGYEMTYNPFTMELDFIKDFNWSGYNLTADYFIGNGSQLTSLTHSLDDAYDDGSVIQVDDGDLIFNLDDTIPSKFIIQGGGFDMFTINPLTWRINLGWDTILNASHAWIRIAHVTSFLSDPPNTLGILYLRTDENKFYVSTKQGQYSTFGVIGENVTFDYGNFTSLSAEEINRDLATNCPADTYQYGDGDNLSVRLCRTDQTVGDNGSIIRSGVNESWVKAQFGSSSNITYDESTGTFFYNGTTGETDTTVNNTGFVNITELRVRNITSPYDNRSNIFFLSDGSVGITLDPIIPMVQAQEEIKSEITRTASTETYYKNGVPTGTVLYSGTRFVNEDNQWKELWEAKSLKGIFNIKYIKDDGIHDFEIVDLNYTSIELRVFVKNSKELNKFISFKVDDIQKTTKKLISLSDKATVTFTSENILASNYTFGTKSTTIILQDADSENMEDSHAYDLSPNTNYGSATEFYIRGGSAVYRTYIKFNISHIPSGQIIDESKLFLYLNLVDSSPTNYWEAHHVYNQTWSEEVLTWNNQPCGTAFDDSNNCNLTAEDTVTYSSTSVNLWISWTVTNMLKKDYDGGNSNFSIGFRQTNEGGLTHHGRFWSKEWTDDTTLRPYLNITYSLAPAIRVTTTLDSPADGSTDEDGTVTFNCSATAEQSNLVNITLYHNITGTWKVNKTQGVGGTSAYANFTYKVANQTNLIWNCLSSNDATNTSFADANWTLTVRIPPLKNPKFFIQNLAGSTLWYVDLLGDMWLRNDFNMGGDLNVDGDADVGGNLNTTTLNALTYYSTGASIPFNFYDDGTNIMMNMTATGDEFGVETDNSKYILFNEPKASNDFKVFQVFSKEAQDVTEFVVTKKGVGHTAYFVRSLAVGVYLEADAFNCTSYANFINCDTDLDKGGDLFVMDDVEINGSLYVANGNFRIDDSGNVNSTGYISIGSSSAIKNITMFTNPSGNPACCGVMDDYSWGCTAGVCS